MVKTFILLTETISEILEKIYALIYKLYTVKMNYWYQMNS